VAAAEASRHPLFKAAEGRLALFARPAKEEITIRASHRERWEHSYFQPVQGSMAA